MAFGNSFFKPNNTFDTARHPGIVRGVLSLVTRMNGVCFALFHVEHLRGAVWHYRWRITPPCPRGYGEWRECRSAQPRVVVQPEIVGCGVEVQWRDDPADDWRQAALHESAAGTCLFRVRALCDFRFPDEPLDALAAIGDGFVAHYRLPPVDLAAGASVDVTGIATGPHADNVLLQPGEFVTVDPRLRIDNLDESKGSLIPSPGGSMVLSVHPSYLSRRVFATVARNSNKKGRF